MRILLLNGPPRCGKDTIARILKQSEPSFVHLEKFARPMKMVTPLIYNVTRDQWEKHLDTSENKDLPCSEFFGKTPRQVQIALSEDYLKPLHGKKIFGDLLIRRIEMLHTGMTECVIISDSGFREEAEQVIQKYGAHNVELWRIHRDGCNFKSDSRNYIDLRDYCDDAEGLPALQQYDVDNNGCLDDLRDWVVPMYKALVTPRENEETFASWQRRRVELAQKAIREYPQRRIERIKKQG